MRVHRVHEYNVTVHPDGSWRVEYVEAVDGYGHRSTIASGSAEDQRRGELAARCAIEDDKATRAKEQVEASMVQHFTVKA